MSRCRLGSTTTIDVDGNLTFATGLYSAGAATLTAVGASFVDQSNGAFVDVTAPSLALAAQTGVGTSGTPLRMQIGALSATTVTRGIFIDNDLAVPGSGVLTGLGSAANNTLSFYDAPQGVSVNLQTGVAVFGPITDTINDFAKVIGSPFNDTITFSDTLNDTVTGNGGGDTFAFDQHFANDVITDFSPATGLIDFNHNDFASFAAVQANAAQQGANVVITSAAAGGSLTLDNLQLAALHASNFNFV